MQGVSNTNESRDAEKDEDGKQLGIIIIILLIVSIPFYFILPLVSMIYTIIALIAASSITCQCCGVAYSLEPIVKRFVTGTTVSLALIFVLQIIYVIGASLALANDAEVSSSGNVSFEEDTIEGVTTGAMVLTGIIIALDIAAIIFTGLFVWGRKCWSNQQLKRKAIALSSMTFIVAVGMIASTSSSSSVQSSPVDSGAAGNWNEEKYPNCHVSHPHWIGDGTCHHEYNTAACGFDGGDCLDFNIDFNRNYPNCRVNFPSKIGDGNCDKVGGYRTEECGWDGGDCEIGILYPNCHVYKPRLVGDGKCDADYAECDGYDLYNSEVCGWDGGDCLAFNRKYPGCIGDAERIGRGPCDRKYNTEVCGWDGGDCLFAKKYPGCYIESQTEERLGDGICDIYDGYNTEECGFDAGDCIERNSKIAEVKAKYPDCKELQYLDIIGNGSCDTGSYDIWNTNPGTMAMNTKECGWDGGDCIVAEFPDCHAAYESKIYGFNPSKIGDGVCDSGAYRNSGGYNIKECGWDGGDCLDFEGLPDCHHRNPEDGYDGGYCLDFNYSPPLIIQIVEPTTVTTPEGSGGNITQREYSHILKVESPELLTEVQVGIYGLLMQSYTADFGFMAWSPDIKAVCTVLNQDIQSESGLLMVQLTMEYQSDVYDTDGYPDMFMEYINSNLERVLADMSARFLPVIEIKDVRIVISSDLL